MDARSQLIALCDNYAEHFAITHWAVSMRIVGKGNFFQRLKSGGDCQTSTYERALKSFSGQWPDDLEWPEGVPRPEPSGEAA